MRAADLSPPDLCAEYDLALAAYRPQQIAAGKRRRQLGVRTTAYLPPFGLARVARRNRTLYRPVAYDWESGDAPAKGEGAGLPALIIPLIGEDGDSLLDLLAFYGDEGHYLRRTGVGGGLDLAYADRQIYEGRPIALAAAPLDWLRRGGNALCVLDWQDPGIDHLLRWSCGIHAGGDLDLAAAVYKHLRRPLKRSIPEVTVDRADARGRAA